MPRQKEPFDQKAYNAAMKKEHDGLINCLNYILKEVEDAEMALVSLHLKLAIEEIRDFEPPAISK